MFDSQGHGVRQKLLEGVGWHAFQSVSVHPIHELLESKYLDPCAHAFQTLGRHQARKQKDDEDSEKDRTEHP